MTDRVKGFIVTLGEDVRTDDAAAIRSALTMVKGVIDVQPVSASVDDLMTRARVRRELSAALWAALDGPAGPGGPSS